MADPIPSFNDLVALGKGEAQDVRPSLVFADGDQSTAIIRGGAAMCDHVLGWFAGEIRKLFFGSAVGDELDAIIMDRMQMPRTPATAAYGSITFTGTGSGTAGVVPSGNQEATAPDVTGASSTYLTDYDLVYPATSFALTVTATCALAGKAGNTSPATLSIVDALDPTITATTTGFAGGNDAETDEHYMLRAVNHFLTERRGTLAALEEGVIAEVDGVTYAHAIEDIDTGIVTVNVSDDQGNSTDEMVQAADVALEEWRSAGVYVTARGMEASVLTLVIWIVDYAPGFDVAAATPTIIASIANRLSELRPGQTLYLDEIRSACIAPYATQIYKIAFGIPGTSGIVLDSVPLSPTDDIVPADGKAIRLHETAGVVDGIGILDGKP